jgi:hypothetical protein
MYNHASLCVVWGGKPGGGTVSYQVWPMQAMP